MNNYNQNYNNTNNQQEDCFHKYGRIVNEDVKNNSTFLFININLFKSTVLLNLKFK